jgi:hypothetical protein
VTGDVDLHGAASRTSGGPVFIVDFGEGVGGRGIGPGLGRSVSAAILPGIGSFFGGTNVDSGFPDAAPSIVRCL